MATQSSSCMSMLHAIYLWIPMGIMIVVAVLMTRLDVEKANEKLRAKEKMEK